MMFICYCRERRDNIVSKYHPYDAFSLLIFSIALSYFIRNESNQNHEAQVIEQELFQLFLTNDTITDS